MLDEKAQIGSPNLFNKRTECRVVATGTLNVNQKEVPKEISVIKKITDRLPRGFGYYFHSSGSDITYCVWQDTKTVVLASTAFPAHAESTERVE